jgi:1-deoxy-D-xylulose-5-phosphate reductoisomerase
VSTTRVIVLGSTGSIGRQTLEVIDHLNAMANRHGRGPTYEVVGLSCCADVGTLRTQAQHFHVRHLAVAESGPSSTPGEIREGEDASLRLIDEVEADLIVGAIVGVAGLPAILRAVELGRTIALANKETLVAAGSLVVDAARRSGARILPIDSEHAAIWQCLGASMPPPTEIENSISRLILTASGGPFRDWDKSRIDGATPEMALAHPTWRMGAKVTVDSASLMNKALEVIEAHWLFGATGDQIDALIHSASLSHSIVEFVDGSSLVQVAAPDMRIPIQQSLTWPERLPTLVESIELSSNELCFEKIDLDRFPAFGLAHECLERGGLFGAIVNAANEVAVEAFLAGRIPFGRMYPLVSAAASSLAGDSHIGIARDLQDVLDADRQARTCVRSSLDEN